MRRAVLLAFTVVLLAATGVRAESRAKEDALVLRIGTALVTGTLATGYAFAPLLQLRAPSEPVVFLLPVAFAVGASLGVPLGGWIGGRSGNVVGALVAGILPTLLLATVVGSLRSSALLVGLFTVPIISIAGAMMGYEMSIPPAHASVLPVARVAVADRSPSW